MRKIHGFVHAVTLAALAGGAISAQPDPLPGVFDNGEQFVQHNGVVYRVQKAIVDGEPVRLFLHGGQSYTDAALRAKVAAEAPKILSDDASALAATARADETIRLAVTLRPQPASPVARVARAQIEGDLRTLSRAALDVTSRFLPRERLESDAERAWVVPEIPADALAERRAFSRAIDTLLDGTRREMAARIHEANLPHQQTLESFVVDALGGSVYARTTHGMSMMFVEVPAGAIERLAAHELVASIDIDHPGEPELDNMAISLGLTTGFWANSITGGVHDIGVLDTGVQQNHPNLSPHNFLSNMGTTDTGSHGTGMAGIMASTHPTWRGMSYGIDTIVVARAGAISTSMPGMNYIASTGVPEAVNYSFGNGTANSSDYNTTDQFFDGTISTFRFMVSKSAGNGGFGTGNPTITHPAPAYNLMATANMDDFNNTNRATHRITSSSSRGPTVLGRKKPDITAPGNNSFSTTPSGGFANIGGTSSAAPKVGSGIVLLWDAGVTNIMAGKAILINTADAMNDNGTSSTADDVYVDGSLWNRRYGWGYMNLGRAYLNVNNVFLGWVTGRNASQPYRFYSGPMQPFDKATLVWERHVAYNGANFPTQIESLSDLDLWAYRESNNAGIAASTSAIDNVEQLHNTQAQPVSSVVLKVSAFGNFDPDVPNETFAIATPAGFSARVGPAMGSATHLAPTLPAGQTTTLTVSVQNIGDLTAHSVSAALVSQAGFTILSGPVPASVASVSPGASATFEWQVITPSAPNSYLLQLSTSTTSYGETIARSPRFSVTVGGCPGDSNGDGVVNFSDLNVVLTSFGATGAPGSLAGDVNGDGVVNFSDLNLVLSNFGLDCN